MFMQVAAAFLSMGGEGVLSWAFLCDATQAEQDEALRVFGPPHEGCVGIAQTQIRRAPDGSGWLASKPSWDCGPVRGATLTDLYVALNRERCEQAPVFQIREGRAEPFDREPPAGHLRRHLVNVGRYRVAWLDLPEGQKPVPKVCDLVRAAVEARRG